MIVPRSAWNAWLDDAAGSAPPTALIAPYDGTSMRTVRVSTWVNTSTHDDAMCVEPLDVGDA